jgi:hypothetical protein
MYLFTDTVLYILAPCIYKICTYIFRKTDRMNHEFINGTKFQHTCNFSLMLTKCLFNPLKLYLMLYITYLINIYLTNTTGCIPISIS